MFLAPATTKNLKTTIERGVRLDHIERALMPEQQASLKKINTAGIARCFAVQESSRNQFDEMSSGDLVLFAEEGTGRFGYAARVLSKLERKELGSLLWDDSSWRLIYFLDPEQSWRINRNKKNTVKECGYDENFWLPKFMQVRSQPFASIKTKYGSLAQFLDSNGD